MNHFAEDTYVLFIDFYSKDENKKFLEYVKKLFDQLVDYVADPAYLTTKSNILLVIEVSLKKCLNCECN